MKKFCQGVDWKQTPLFLLLGVEARRRPRHRVIPDDLEATSLESRIASVAAFLSLGQILGLPAMTCDRITGGLCLCAPGLRVPPSRYLLARRSELLIARGLDMDNAVHLLPESSHLVIHALARPTLIAERTMLGQAVPWIEA